MLSSTASSSSSSTSSLLPPTSTPYHGDANGGPRAQHPARSSASSSARTSSSPAASSRRWHRLSDRPALSRRSHASPRRLLHRGWKLYVTWSERIVAAYLRLSPLHRALAVIACILGWVLLILMLVYSHRFFSWLAPHSEAWRKRPAGWLLIFFAIFITAFPPVMGYSTATTISGFVYGFPLGWPIAASACVAGSLCAFLMSRTVLSGYVDRLVGKDHRFIALGQVLRKEGILYLTGIRFCPLPFSLSNGFLATIPSISPLSFALSTAFSSPKLLVHVFIGSRLAVLAEKGDSMTAADKAINYASMLVGGAIGVVIGLIIYRRTMARAAELQREGAGAEEGDAGYEDTDATLMDPDDAATVMSDDDLSLWDMQGSDSWESGHDRSHGHATKQKRPPSDP